MYIKAIAIAILAGIIIFALYKNKPKQESNYVAKLPGEKDTAIGNILFHISEEEFKKEKELFINKNFTGIGGFRFQFITGSFSNDSLYRLFIISPPYNFEREADGQKQALIVTLKEKYGEGKETGNGGSKLWHYKDNMIDAYTANNSQDGKHYTFLRIQHKSAMERDYY